ncbi:MAG: aspartate--tRNA(Asn) ligase [Candidatus Woesearchaeota archaeon]
MERTLLKNIQNKINEDVLIKGWVQDFRNLNKLKFIIIRDRTGLGQLIALKDETPEKIYEKIADLPQETVIEAKGKVVENKQSRFGYEIKIGDIKVITKANTPLPIDNSDKSNTTIDKRIDHRFLDTRNMKHQAKFKIRSKIVKILTNFFDKEGFTNIQTSKLTKIGVESGAELFKVNYFGDSVYLSQSPQVYKQMFVAGGFERVFEIGPVFRAEKSNTTRHLTEFTGVDFEMGFINNMNDIMDLIEAMIKDLLENLKIDAVSELNIFNISLVVPKKIPRIEMSELKKVLKEKGKILSEDDDLDSEAERLIGEYAKEKYNSDFIFVTKYPWEVRPFYHMRSEDNKDETESFDLLFNGVEIATGAQREHRLEVLSAQSKEKGLNLDDMEKYKEIFEYGMPPHGGAGFGLDRITQRLLGIDNVREVVLLPRDPDRKTP